MTGRVQDGVRRAGSSLAARRTARTHPQTAVRVQVTRAVDVTPSMRRVTLTGPDLAGWPVLGNDHYVRVLLPRPDQVEPALPRTAKWYPELLRMPTADRPVLRNYTLRDVRPAQAEVDIDFALHGDGGPACSWALRARPGDVVGLIEQGVLFTPDPAADHLLLVADDTGLPGVHGIVRLLPDALPTTIVVEVTSEADQQDVGREVSWLHRLDPRARPGQLALSHAVALRLQTRGRGQAWLAGESGMVTGLRRHLVNERGYAKADISFTGYFRHGRAQYAE